jgi:thiol-disulfide isomerase/thioredoxin
MIRSVPSISAFVLATALASSLVCACGGAELPNNTASSAGVGEPAAKAVDAPAAEGAKGSGPDGNGTHVGDAKPTEVAPAPAGPMLGETAEAKLGTAPPGFGLAVGQRAPDATLEDLTGKKQKLSELYKSGPTFVVFYRGGWCPFCNLQLHDLAAAKADFDKRGIRLVAISVDKPSEEAKTQAPTRARRTRASRSRPCSWSTRPGSSGSRTSTKTTRRARARSSSSASPTSSA